MSPFCLFAHFRILLQYASINKFKLKRQKFQLFSLGHNLEKGKIFIMVANENLLIDWLRTQGKFFNDFHHTSQLLPRKFFWNISKIIFFEESKSNRKHFFPLKQKKFKPTCVTECGTCFQIMNFDLKSVGRSDSKKCEKFKWKVVKLF